jgi:DNA-binding MarR family transcriptional regulator
VPALVQRLAHSGAERMRADFAARGMPTLRPVHAMLLVPLLGGGRHASRLAEDLGVTRQAVAQVVTTLERDGYVRRVTDPGDARAKLICLTPRGRSALRTMHASARATEEDWRRRLGAERLAEFRATLLALLSGEDHPSPRVLKGHFQVAVEPSPPAASSRAAATRTGGPACALARLSWSSGWSSGR